MTVEFNDFSDQEKSPPIILIAEDNIQTRNLLNKFFTKANERKDLKCETIEANDGEEAIEMLDTIYPHIILCDIGMPNKDGFEVLEHFNTVSKKTNPFCFFSFLSAAPEEKIRAFNEGAMGFLSKKEINYFMIVLQIKAWIRLSRLERFYEKMKNK